MPDSSLSSTSLPQDCAIVATEAVARIHAAGLWARIISIVYSTPAGPTGHMLTIWAPAKPEVRGQRSEVRKRSKEPNLICYDRRGTVELGINSRDIADVIPAVAKAEGMSILNGHFITP